jgi:hypothetical protein
VLVVGGTLVESPDIVLEVVLTSGGIEKLEVYAGLGVREVWFFERGRFHLHELGADGYRPIEHSALDLVHSIDLYERGDFAGHEEAAAANERRLRSLCRGVAWKLRTTQLLSCTSLFFLGRLDELAEKVPEWMSSATERGDLYATTNVLALAMPIVLLARDEVDEARAALDRAASQWRYEGFTMQRLFRHYTETVLRLYAGEVEDAYQGIVEGDREVRRSLVLRDRAVGNYRRFIRSSATAAKAARAESGRGALWRQIRRDARRLDRDDAPCYRAMGAALRAAVCAQRGDRDGAVAERAVEQLDASSFALYAACARCTWAS